jgi:pimeloyl-ACP methyl ester carboxylesterase
MPYAQAAGAKLYYEETGSGHPIIFAHEFSADYRTWETQVRWFSREYRCITYNARGYPPSDVPTEAAAYGQDPATDDIAAVLDHLGIAKAHVVGLSMGASAVLHFGMRYPHLASALVVTGCGTGAIDPAGFRTQSEALAGRWRKEGALAMAKEGGLSPTRVQLRNKDRRGWEEFVRYLGEHSATGSANTMANYQALRPSLFDLQDRISRINVPTLLIVGDEDEPCLETNLFLKRTIPTAGLWVVPRTGHGVNIEEPGLFNEAVQAFFSTVERGRWGERDPIVRAAGIQTRVGHKV